MARSLADLPGQISPSERRRPATVPAVVTPAQTTTTPSPPAGPVFTAPTAQPGLNGVNTDLASRVQALIAASHGRINVQSGFRTTAQQADLYRRKPDLAAPPGHSNHEKGLAVDLGGDYALIAQLAPQFGLVLPMSWEPWHVELPGQHAASSPQAYTTSPYGDPNPTQDPNLTSTGPYTLATAVSAMRSLADAPLGELTGPQGAGVTPSTEAAGASASNVPGSSSGGSSGGPIGPVALQSGQTGGDKRVPGHTIQDWAHDVLTGLGAPVTPQNMDTLVTWANTESGGYNPGAAGGRYNPLNTTEGAVGYVGQGGSQGNIKDFGTYQQGIQAIVHNLTQTKGAGYEHILGALHANDSQAVFQAVNNSAFGTHFGAH